MRPLFERLRLGVLGGTVGGGAIAFTLMACYGSPPCDDGTDDCFVFNGDAGSTEGDAARDARRPDVEVRDGSTGDAADASDDASPDDGGRDADADTDAG